MTESERIAKGWPEQKRCAVCGGKTFTGFVHHCPKTERLQKSNLDKLTNTLHAIAIMFDLEVHEDLPSGEPSAICERIEQVVQGRCLKSFQRGLRSSLSSQGRDPDELPFTTRDSLTAILTQIQSETCISGYDSGHVGVEKLAREGLELLKIQHGQTPEELPGMTVEMLRANLQGIYDAVRLPTPYLAGILSLSHASLKLLPKKAEAESHEERSPR